MFAQGGIVTGRKTLIGFVVITFSLIMVSESVLAARGGHGGRSGSHSGGNSARHSGGHAAPVVPRFSGHRHAFPRPGPRIILNTAPVWYYPLSPLYYPLAIAAPATLPVYVEQGAASAVPAYPQGYWYYCADTQAYYPYVNECPGGWQPVAPRPADTQ